MSVPPNIVTDALAALMQTLVAWEVEQRRQARRWAVDARAKLEAKLGADLALAHRSKLDEREDRKFVEAICRKWRPLDEAVLESADQLAGEYWTMDEASLLQSDWMPAADALPPPDAPVEKIVPLLLAAMRLDKWMLPLDPAVALDPIPLLPGHDAALTRLNYDEQWNSNSAVGALIPAVRERLNTQSEPLADPIGVLSRFFDHTSYLPPRLEATDPDGMACALHGIAATYRSAAPALLNLTGLPEPEVWRLAIAPIVEGGADVALSFTADRSAYGMDLRYDKQRIDRVIARAFDEGAHLLFMPEMAVRGADVPYLTERLRHHRLRYLTDRDQLPHLRYVFAGVLDPTPSAAGRHHNLVKIFDADGSELASQVKLSHWNFNRHQQRLFGLEYHHRIDFPDELMENSEPAECLEVVDLPQIGRVVTLICADVNRNDPGDWLMANARIDWLHFPIMDKSVCWDRSVATGYGPPWIVSRAYRASLAGSAKVVVTNSMALTTWVNGQNGRTGSPFGLLSNAGIGLALNHRGGAVRQHHVTVPLTERDVIMVFDWHPDAWPIFPAPPFTPPTPAATAP